MKERVRAFAGQVWRYPGKPESKVVGLGTDSELRLIATMRPLAPQRAPEWKIDSVVLETEGTLTGTAALPQMPVEMIEPPPEPRRHAHYFRSVAGLQEIDIYRVLELFGVTDQALGHAAKKIMMPGLRGAKATRKDIEEAIDTLQRRLEMMDEDDHRQNAAGDSYDSYRSWANRAAAAPVVPSPSPTCAPLPEGFKTWHGRQAYAPVVNSTKIEAIQRGGNRIEAEAGSLHWGHTGDGSDVIAYRQSPAAPTPPVPQAPAPWYPDDSGEWGEVPDDAATMPAELSADTEINVLERGERQRNYYHPSIHKAGGLIWGLSQGHAARIVAYRKVPRV